MRSITIKKRLGKVIRNTRQDLGMTQEELAFDSDIARSHMGQIERGEIAVSVVGLHRIAAALKLKSSDLLTKSGM